MKHCLITILIILTFFVTPSLAYKAKNRGPIVETSNPNITTHYLYAGDVILGLSSFGGGYVNYFYVPGKGNVVSANYGRGWQGSIRDELHSGRYNPTQAGFTDFAGAPAVVSSTAGRLWIPPFQMALYGDPVFDFTENEDLVPDASIYNDFGRQDKDGIFEYFLSQDSEIRSEFDYQGDYQDISQLVQRYNVSAIKHVYRNTYVRSPSAIYQFGPSAVQENGSAVYNPSKILSDISVLLPGNQTPSVQDLSKIIFTAYGIRLKKKLGF